MKMLAKIPVAHNPVNQTADILSGAAAATAYDEIIVDYPAMASTIDLRWVNSVFAGLNRPVWICLPTIWPEDTEKTPANAYTALTAQTLATLTSIMTMMVTANMQSKIKGFAFDIDYKRTVGDISLSGGVAKHLDRDTVNAFIAAAHGYTLPAMIITNRVIDALGLVYRGTDTDSAGRAAWPTLLGSVSSIGDWIVARDSIGSAYFLNGYSSPVRMNAHLLAENISIMAAHRSSTLSTGMLQHVNYNHTSPDYMLGHNYSPALRDYVRGVSTLAAIAGVDGSGIIALTNPGVPTVPLRSSIEPYSLPVNTGGTPRYHSSNGTHVFDFMVSDTVANRLEFSYDFRKVTLNGIEVV